MLERSDEQKAKKKKIKSKSKKIIKKIIDSFKGWQPHCVKAISSAQC